MQEMKAMFKAFKTDIEKDSDALRDRIKDLEEQLSREKAKSKGGSEEPQSMLNGPTVIIPPILSSITPAAGSSEVFTAPPVAPANKDARSTSPTVLTPRTFKPWVSTPPVDTSIRVPPLAPPPSVRPSFVPGGWKATKPHGLARSSTTGNLSNGYRASSPVIYPNLSYGGVALPNPPEYASYDSRPASHFTPKKRNSTPTPTISSHHHQYPTAPLRRSRTEATVMPSMPPMPHYPTPPSSHSSYPVLSQPPVWHNYPPHFEHPIVPAMGPPLGMPVSIAQEPPYSITYGGTSLGL